MPRLPALDEQPGLRVAFCPGMCQNQAAKTYKQPWLACIKAYATWLQLKHQWNQNASTEHFNKLTFQQSMASQLHAANLHAFVGKNFLIFICFPIGLMACREDTKLNLAGTWRINWKSSLSRTNVPLVWAVELFGNICHFHPKHPELMDTVADQQDGLLLVQVLATHTLKDLSHDHAKKEVYLL